MLARAYNPAASQEDNLARIRNLRKQIQAALDAKVEAAKAAGYKGDFNQFRNQMTDAEKARIGIAYEQLALDKAKADAQNTNISKFLNNLESRIYAQISQNLATAMFANGGTNNSGTLNFEGNTIY